MRVGLNSGGNECETLDAAWKLSGEQLGGARRQIPRFLHQAQLLMAVSAPGKTECSAGLSRQLFDPPARTAQLFACLFIRQFIKHAVVEQVSSDFEPRTKVADLDRTH